MNAFLNARDGGAATIAAITIGLLALFTALAVDLGSVYLRVRQLQGMADLAAIAAASDLDSASMRARETVDANRWPGAVAIETEIGAYRGERQIAVADRFAADAGPANAARVRLTADAPLFFAAMLTPDGRMHFTREAVAAQTELASFSIGSRLLSVEGGIANALLSGLTGSSVSLRAMDYQALASAEVDLFSYVDALKTRMDMEAGSFNDALDARVSPADAIGAIADTLVNRDSVAGEAIDELAEAADQSQSLDGLSGLVDLGPYGDQDVTLAGGEARVTVNALDLATAVLELAQGDRQVRLDLGAGVPGLADTQVWLAIGERPNQSPWLAITNDREVIIRTAQMRLYIETRVLGGAAPLAGAAVRLPVLVEAASAEARLGDIQCGARPIDRAVTLRVSPSVGMLAIADIDRNALDDFKSELRLSPARLLTLPLIRAEARARVDIGGEDWQDVRFSADDIASTRIKTVATRDIAAASVGSLVGNLSLDVRLLGLGLNTGAVTQALRPPLSAAAGALDPLINGLTDLLGVRVGEADVRISGVRCGAATLVM